MASRDQFQALLDQYLVPLDIKAFQAALELEILDLHREKFPKRKAPRNKIPMPGESGRWEALTKLGTRAFPEEFEKICERHLEKAKARVKEYAERREKLDQEMSEMAEEVEFVGSEVAILIRTIHPHDYHTQGLGSDSYARGAADKYCFMFTFNGLKAEVRRIEDEEKRKRHRENPPPRSFGALYHFHHYEVWAYCDRIDHEVAMRRKISTKDMLQWHWNRGLNPRVYDPFLPHGLEEKLGVKMNLVTDEEGNPCP